MSSSSYDPLPIVESTHHILHLNSRLQRVDNTFNISYSDFNNEYSRSLVPIPALCVAMGLIALIIFQLALCIRMCYDKCRCLPEDAGLSGTNKDPKDSYRYKYLVYLLGAGCVLTVIAVQSYIFGASFLTHGVNTSQDTINYLFDVFSSLDDYGTTLDNLGDDLDNEFQQAASTGCDAATYLDSFIPTYQSYVDDYESYISPVPNKLSTVSDKLDLWGITYQNYTIWALYGIFMIIIGIYILSYFCKNFITMRVGIACSQILLIILFLAIGAEMFVMMGFSDFCMEPVTFTPPLVPDSIRNITIYYTSCQGVNPVQSIVNEAEAYLVQVQSAVQSVAATPDCAGNTYLAESLQTISTIDSILGNVTALLACPPTQNELVNFLQTDLCQDVFRGTYTIWLGQYFSVGLLFATSILAALVYQYFGGHPAVETLFNQTVEQNNVLFPGESVESSTNDIHFATAVASAPEGPSKDGYHYDTY